MANNQQINIGLKFNADVGQARQQLESLKSSLNSLGSLNNIDPTARMNKNIGESIAAVAKLKTQLEAATNVNTGKLDLTKFSKQLRNSGMNLDQYRKQLSALGPQGKQAFLDLASSIQQAEMPLLSLNKLASSLWDSLKRTAKWQISSSAIHAVMGAVQTAYHYAQDLNESLNNIRIVTGQSTQQMAKFAAEANKAAKALGTTTTAYTDAALIYYQQGLTDSEVKERTDITVKMANVARESAEIVSNQLTAVWNNFANGTDTLESFADKMVALGAATASSSDEIAQGLEKFAATAETTGLSFDYAAAALATVTATTRQSADTVGTAFKTVFARLESLKLGDSLEDGTDLTKYSEALATVGVNIKQANGEIKDMDDIIDETMNKWQTLSKDQQIALAQTVAGQRQYTQFMALMSNADFFKENLQTINESTGALNEQNEIYQESWEAASKRVQAAMESIYDQLINDKFFIEATNQLEKFITMISRFIDSIGGVGGLLTTLGVVLTRLFSDQIAASIRNISFDIQNLLTNGKKAEELREQATQNVNILQQNAMDPVLKEQVTQYNEINSMMKELNDAQKSLTKEQFAQYSAMIDIQRLSAERITNLKQEAEEIRKNYQTQRQYALETTGFDDSSQKRQETKYLLGANTRQKNAEEELQKTLRARRKSSEQPAVEKARENLEKMRKDHKASLQQQYGFSGADATVDKFIQDRKSQLSIASREERKRLEREISEVKKLAKLEAEAQKRIEEAEQKRSATNQEIEDSDKRVKQLEKEREIIKDLQQFLRNNGGEDTWFTQTGKFFDELYAKTENVEGLKIATNELRQNLVNLEDNVEQKQEAFVQFFENLKAGGFDITQLQEALGAQGDKEDLSTWLQRVIQESGGFENALKKIDSAVASVGQKTNEYADKIRLLIERTVPAGEEQEEMLKVITAIKTSAPSAAEALLKFGQSKNFALKQKKDFEDQVRSAKGMQDYATAITQATSAMSSFGMSISSIKGIIDTLNNQDLSFFEKLQQLLVSIPMAVGGVVTAIGALQKLLTKKLPKIEHQDLLEKFLNENGISEQDYWDELTKRAKLRKKGHRVRSHPQYTRKMTDTLGAENRDIVLAESKQIIDANIKESGSWKTKGATILKSIGPYLAIAAAVALVAGVIYAAVKHYNKDAEAAEKAAAAHKQMADAANEAKEAYENLKTTISGYNDATKRMSELVEGTLEYKKALADANEKALELIKNNKDLKYHYENGLIVFDDQQQLKDIQERAFNQQQFAQAQAIRSEVVANQAQQTADRTDFARKNLHAGNGYGAANAGVMGATGLAAGAGIGAVAGIKYGASIGTLFGGPAGAIIGLLAGAAIGVIGGAVASGITGAATKNEKNAQDELIKQYSEGNEEAIKLVNDMKTGAADTEDLINRIKTITGATDSVAKAMAASAEEMAEFVETQAGINEENKILLKESLRTQLTGNEAFDKSNYQEAILNSLTNQIGTVDENSQYYKDAKQLLHGSEEELAAKYLKAVFGNEASNYRIVGKFGTNWTLQKKTDGEAFENVGGKNTLSQDIVLQRVAEEDAIQEYLSNLPTTSAEQEKIGKQFTSLIKSVGANLAEKELQDIVSDLVAQYSDTGKLNLTQLTFDQLEQLNQAIKDNSEAYRSMDENAQKAFETAIEGAAEAKRQTNLAASGNYNANRESIEANLFAQGAESANLTTKEFNLWAKSIQNANSELKLTERETKLIAADIAKTSKALDTLDESYTDIKDTIEKINKNPKTLLSPEEVQDLTTIQQALNDWLGVEFSFEQMAENSDLIESAIRGNVESIRDLQHEAAKIFIEKIDIDDNLKNQFNEFLANADSVIEGDKISIGVDLNVDNEEAFLNNINEAVQSGKANAQELEEAFLKAGYALEIEGTQPKEIGPNTTDIIRTVDEGRPIHIHEETTQTIQVPKYKGIKSLGSGSKQALGSSKDSKGSSSKKQKKTVDSETERYYNVNKELDKLQRKYNQLDAIKNSAFGGRHIKAIEEEIKIIEQEQDALARRTQEAKEYLQKDMGALQGYGAVFREDGSLANYDELIRKNVTGLQDDAYEDFKKVLSEYESSYKTWLDSIDEEAAKAREKLEKEFEKVEYTIEFKLKLPDVKKNFLEWELSHLDDKDFAAAERAALKTAQIDLIQNQYDINKQGILDILKTAGASQEQIDAYMAGNGEAIAGLIDFTSQAYEDLQQYTQALMDSYDDLIAIKQYVEEQLTSTWEEYNNKVSETEEIYDHLTKKVEYFKNIIDIVGMERLGVTSDALQSLEEQSIKIAQSQLEAEKSSYARYESELREARRHLAEATTDKNRQDWKHMINDLEKQMRESEGKIMEYTTNILQNLADNYQSQIERIMKDFEKSVSGVYESLEDLSNAFNQQKTLREQYLPDYERLYELNKLNRNINKEIGKLDSVKNQQKLRDLQEEISALQRDGVEMSKYDLDYLQKKYDLRLAEIALEEAQNNKTEVRLMRDMQGNYSYVYTANEEAQEDALQKYEDALYTSQSTTEEYVGQLQDQIIQIQSEWSSAIQEAAAIKDPENRKRKVQQINDFYKQQYDYLTNELNKAMNNNSQLYNQDYLNYANHYDMMELRGNNFTQFFNDTILGTIYNGYSSIEQVRDDYLEKMATAQELINERADEFDAKIKEVLESIGLSVEDFSKLVDSNLSDVNDDTDATLKKIQALNDKGSEAFKTLANTVSSVQQQVSDKLGTMSNDIGTLQTALETLITTAEKVKDITIPDIPSVTPEKTPAEIAREASGGPSKAMKKAMELDSENRKELSSINLNKAKSTGLINDSLFELKARPYLSKNQAIILVEGKTQYQLSKNKTDLGELIPKGLVSYNDIINNSKMYDEVKEQLKDAFWRSKLNSDSNKNKIDISDTVIGHFQTHSGQDIFVLDPSQMLTEEDYFKQINKKSFWDIFDFSNTSSSSFSSGGYTGAWGSEGKLATLHEKELVLNKQDTQNMLATVDFVRSLSQMVDLQALANRFSAVVAPAITSSSLANNNSNVSQEIHIDASFPGVTAREEIEQAFSDLALQAAQYVNR